MNLLALCKELLRAQSAINREQLVVEFRNVVSEVHQLKGRLIVAGTAVTSAASVGIAGIKAMGQVREIYSQGRGSWLSALLNGLRAGTALWKSVRPRSGH